MSTIIRLRVSLGGAGIIGPGLTTFYFADAHTGFVSDVGALFGALSARFPSQLTWSIPASGDLINDVTGDLVGVWNDGVASAGTGSGTSAWAQGVGFRSVWETAGTTNNRRVRGTTFWAPVDGTMLQTDGTLNDTARASALTACETFLTASDGNLRIWTRPRAGVTGKSTPVTSVNIPDKISWLRSRRT